MPYRLIILAAAIVMATRHALDVDTSRRSKQIVIGALIGSLVIPFVLVGWNWLSIVLQLGVCVYLIFYNVVANDAV